MKAGKLAFKECGIPFKSICICNNSTVGKEGTEKEKFKVTINERKVLNYSQIQTFRRHQPAKLTKKRKNAILFWESFSGY